MGFGNLAGDHEFAKAVPGALGLLLLAPAPLGEIGDLLAKIILLEHRR